MIGNCGHKLKCIKTRQSGRSTYRTFVCSVCNEQIKTIEVDCDYFNRLIEIKEKINNIAKDLKNVNINILELTVRKRNRKPKIEIEVPKWVPTDFHKSYVKLTKSLGEEEAASYIRLKIK